MLGSEWPGFLLDYQMPIQATHYLIFAGYFFNPAMHGETNSSPRQAPSTVRLPTISHITASNATNTQPDTLKNVRLKVLASFNVAREYTPNGKVKPHQPRLNGMPARR